MTIKSGTGQACAACKYQRRRCTPECLLAPFFPADQPKMFQNVHRLFGVKNIQNLLKDLGPDPVQKSIAMKSIKFHAMMRDKYPVYGCLVEIQQLSIQLQAAEDELQAVLEQLAYYRQHNHNNNDMSPPTPGEEDYISELQLGMAPPGQDHEQQHQRFAFGDYNINYLDFKETNNNNESNNNNCLSNSNVMMALKQETGNDYNEMQPFFDSIDDTHSYIGSKDACCESSLGSSLKGSRTHFVEEMGENELKSATSDFSLINIA